MTDIGTERLLLAALQPLTRQGGLLAAPSVGKGSFAAQLRQAGALTDEIDGRPSLSAPNPASPRYTSSQTMAPQRVNRSERPSGQKREPKRSSEATPAANAPPTQAAQNTNTQQPDRQSSATQEAQPQQAANQTAGTEKEPAPSEMQSSTACEPSADNQNAQPGNQQLNSAEQASRAREIVAAATESIAMATAATAKQMQPQQPSGEQASADTNDPTVLGQQGLAEPTTGETSATQVAADASPEVQEAAAVPLRQTGAIAPANATGPAETAVLAADKPPGARQSQRSKDAASGEARAVGGNNDASAEQTLAAASNRPAAVQLVHSAGLVDAAPAQPTAETASGKGDAVVGVARHNSLAQPASGPGQLGKEQSSVPMGQAADTSAGEKADGLSTLDRVRLVQRVARAFEAIGARAGMVRLRLSPPELGTLRVEIAVRDGTLNAHLQAENHVVRNLLLDNLPALRERLAQQDIRIDRFQVDVFDHSQTGNWQPPAGQSDWQPPGRHRTALGEPAAPAVGKPVGTPDGRRRPSPEGQLDVLV